MFKNRGIAFKLILLSVSACAFIFLCVFGYNYLFSRQMIKKNVEESAKHLAMATVNKIEISLCSLQKVPQNATFFLQNRDPAPKEITELLYQLVKNNPEVYGATIAFEPHACKKAPARFAPHFYKGFEGLGFTDLGQNKGDYRLDDWYQIPKELGRPDWSEPYYDEVNNVLMSTYSVPLYKEIDDRKLFMGVITADISLEKLQEIVASLRILDTGYAFLISQNGMVVTHPRKELIMNATIFGLAEYMGDEYLRALGRKMIRGQSGFVPLKAGPLGKQSWMYYAPIPSNGWSLAVLFPQDELMADVRRFNAIVAVLVVVGLLSLSCAVVFIARSITRPLTQMARATESMAEGNLDVDLPVIGTLDEVGVLAKAFDEMRVSLKAYIKELTETTAAKQRIESELRIAHDIQMSILPKMFPPFPERDDIDIYALIEPAKEVGGDFYDFFFIDDRHICLVIADVSGKGVPASLFMAVTKTLIKAKTTVEITPGTMLSRVNSELCSGNDTNMFVTVFAAILDVGTGEVLYSNGGHNPPLLMHRDGGVTFIEGAHDPIVGVIEDVEYMTRSIILQPGDAICMYTDGVTEAMDPEDELFGEKRLVEEICRLKDCCLEEKIKGLKEAVEGFSAGAPQADDITIMAVQFNGAAHEQRQDFSFSPQTHKV